MALVSAFPLWATPTDLSVVADQALEAFTESLGAGAAATTANAYARAQELDALLEGESFAKVRRTLRRGFDLADTDVHPGASSETFRTAYEQLDQMRRSSLPGDEVSEDLDRLRTQILDALPQLTVAKLKLIRKRARSLRRRGPYAWVVALRRLESLAMGEDLRARLTAAFEELTGLRFDSRFACAVELERLELEIGGMHCANCARRVEGSLRAASDDIVDANVNRTTELGTITFRRGSLRAKKLIDTVERAGFTARVKTATVMPPTKRDGKVRRHFLTATALSLPFVGAMLMNPSDMHALLPGWAQLALATPIQFWLGGPFYKAAWSALKNKSSDMNVLITMGTTAAYAYSVYNLFVHGGTHGHLFFESSAMINTLMLAGRFIESNVKRRTLDALTSLRLLRRDKVLVRRGQIEVELPTGEIVIGDLIIVRPGERLAIDGIVREGAGHVNESFLNGENLAVEKRVGDEIVSGSVNENGRLVVEATAVGDNTMLNRIIQTVEDAQAKKAPIQHLVDKVSGYVVPAVIGVSLATFLGWGLVTGAWAAGLVHAITVLVVSCPCALGLATPTAIMVGTGKAAQEGILIKDTGVLERAHLVSTVAFDKTGTLTENKPEVVSLVPLVGDQANLLQAAASLQRGSDHSFAVAVLNRAAERNLTLLPTKNARALPGEGFEARLDGVTTVIGSERHLKERGFDLGPLEAEARTCRDRGESVSFVGREDASKQVLGLISFRDRIRPGAREAVAELKRRGLKVMMVTGDNEVSANLVAHELGITDVRAGLLPIEKVRVVQKLRANGEVVAMVGDGINDAPALASADVGIAMGSGTDIAQHSAGISLMRTDPRMVAAVLDLSAKTYGKIKQNLFWALGYNVVAIPLAVTGVFGPMVASAAMASSSLGVSLNALLLKLWKPRIP